MHAEKSRLKYVRPKSVKQISGLAFDLVLSILKPFKCSQCDGAFEQNSHLNRQEPFEVFEAREQVRINIITNENFDPPSVNENIEIDTTDTIIKTVHENVKEFVYPNF